MTHIPGTDGYGAHAAAPADQYESLSFADLHRVRALGQRFDLVMLTAVWMHLDAAERAAGMPALASRVADGGQVVMSLRHGPVPEQRRMFDVSAAETIALAAAHGLACHHQGTRADVQGRGGVWWSVVALRRAS